MITQITMGGRTGQAVYLDQNFQPVPARGAAFVRVLFDDGGTGTYTIGAQRPTSLAESIRRGLDLDWDDPATRGVALAQVLGLLERVEAFTASHAGGQAAASAACSQARATHAICGGPSAGGADSSSTVSPASP